MSRLYNYVICPNTTSFLCNSNLSIENITVSASLSGNNISSSLYDTPYTDGGNRIYFATDSPGTYVLDCNLVLRENSHILMTKPHQFPPLVISVPTIPGVIITDNNGIIISDGGTGGTGVKVKVEDIPDLRLPPEEDELFDPINPPGGGPGPGPGPGGSGGFGVRYVTPGDFRPHYVRIRRTIDNCDISPSGSFEVNSVDMLDIQTPNITNQPVSPNGSWGAIDGDCHSDMIVRIDNILDSNYNWTYANIDAVKAAAYYYAAGISAPITSSPLHCCDMIPCANTNISLRGGAWSHSAGAIGSAPVNEYNVPDDCDINVATVTYSSNAPWGEAVPMAWTPAANARPCNWNELSFDRTVSLSKTASSTCGGSVTMSALIRVYKAADSLTAYMLGSVTMNGSINLARPSPPIYGTGTVCSPPLTLARLQNRVYMAGYGVYNSGDGTFTEYPDTDIQYITLEQTNYRIYLEARFTAWSGYCADGYGGSMIGTFGVYMPAARLAPTS